MRPLLPALVLSTGCLAPVDATRCADETGAMADACWMATLEDTAVATSASAVLHCRHIDDRASRDHCLVAAATTSADLPLPQASRVCEEVVDPRWRGECHFQVLERNATLLDPRSYVQSCQASAGPYAGSCIDHGMCYWAAALARPDANHWFDLQHVEDQLRSVQAAGARSHNWRAFAQGVRWRAGLGPPGAGAQVCEGALARAPELYWGDAAAARWW